MVMSSLMVTSFFDWSQAAACMISTCWVKSPLSKMVCGGASPLSFWSILRTFRSFWESSLMILSRSIGICYHVFKDKSYGYWYGRGLRISNSI